MENYNKHIKKSIKFYKRATIFFWAIMIASLAAISFISTITAFTKLWIIIILMAVCTISLVVSKEAQKNVIALNSFMNSYANTLQKVNKTENEKEE